MCRLQAKHLARCLGPSKTTLTHLHLTVRLVWKKAETDQSRKITIITSNHDDGSRELMYKEGSCDLHSEGSFSHIDEKVSCPPYLVDVPCTVFKIMAAAVPNITHLSVLGHCSDAALYAFGANCLHLISLTVEASSVLPQVLDGLHKHLPKLCHLSLTRRGPRGNSLAAFVDAAFFAIAPCTHLLTLALEFGRRVQIKCNTSLEVWQSLPPSLMRLRSTAQLSGLRQATSMLMTVHHLDLVSTFSNSIVQLLRFAPALKSLTLQYRANMEFNSSELRNADGSCSSDFSELQQRLSTLELNCDCLKLKGTYAEMDDVLSRIHPSFATHISMEVDSSASADVNFLQHAAQAFPNMTSFELLAKPTNHSQLVPVSSMSEALIATLIDCKMLTQIYLRHPILWTNAGLLHLCVALPLVSRVKCFLSPDMDHKLLEWQLEQEKPGCQVNLYCV